MDDLDSGAEDKSEKSMYGKVVLSSSCLSVDGIWAAAVAGSILMIWKRESQGWKQKKRIQMLESVRCLDCAFFQANTEVVITDTDGMVGRHVISTKKKRKQGECS